MNRTARRAQYGRGKAPKLFFWTVIIMCVFGLTHLAEPLEDAGRAMRNKTHENNASGDIVLVAIDNASFEAIGALPWDRRRYADIINNANKLGAKQIYIDLVLHGEGSPQEDAALLDAMREGGNVVMATNRESLIDDDLSDQDRFLNDQFAETADLGSINVYFNFQTAAWTMRYAEEIGDRVFPTFASMMAGKSGPAGESFPIDYSIRPESVPKISALGLINGRVARDAIDGKTLILGVDLEHLGDLVYLPGTGRRPGAYVHIFGAETLMRGEPIEAGWIPSVLFAIGLIAYSCFVAGTFARFLVPPIGAAGIVVGATLLESRLVFVDVMPALIGLTVVLSVMTYRFFTSRGYVNALTNLPNLAALRSDRRGRELPLIAARVHNFAEITSTLNADGEKRLVEQIAARLALGRHDGMKLYQGDEGIFAWFIEPDVVVSNHLEALHALFRSPVTIEGQPFDVAVSFGIEMGSGRSLASRLGSALVAADEAEHEAIKWKYHDPARLETTPWKLSMLSQLEEAIDSGEVWIALQPKLDLKGQRVMGAEALARWTHPQKGPISPVEFVAAAEQNDRIGKLTHFVLEEAGKALVQLRRVEPDFTIAVNLSARMLNDRRLTGEILSMLDRHDLPPEALTLELTETAALAGTGSDLELLAQLRAIGIRISIDDYGTGLSTLEYLKKVPASELKIDQSFIKSMRDNRSDLIMVQSTIALAHSLERKVVAEGVEDKQVLEQLTLMDCDIAQGFAVGRPMTLKDLHRRLRRDKDRRVA
ncbi:EAL domain-containing protein [Sphingomicrobium sp. XHP0235]|uniref:EAL domain-containing protein n=1 Tax=Sphingomicrobium aquimarinum TaxID=3133971 RepID=UPI0031FF4003